MNRNLKKALLSLALAALLLPTIGCDYNLDRHGSSGDWTSAWFDFAITPSYGGWSTWDTYSYDEVYVVDTYETSYYDNSYVTDTYYVDDYGYGDYGYGDYGWSWKSKANGKKK